MMFAIDRANACLDFAGLPRINRARENSFSPPRSLLAAAVTRLEHYYMFDTRRCDLCGNYQCRWHKGTVGQRLARIEQHQQEIKSRRRDAHA